MPRSLLGDPTTFAGGTDTLYITSPEQHQAAGAPLIVGLLEQIRHATYAQARAEHAPTNRMLWLLDEVANIAPIHAPRPRLPSRRTEPASRDRPPRPLPSPHPLGPGRSRRVPLPLSTKLILTGIADTRTLEAISLALGEYDRNTITHTLDHSEPQEWFGATPTHSDTVSYQTQRQRVLTPGEIARLPDEHALHLAGADWQTIRLTHWFANEPWKTIAQESTYEHRPLLCT